jgi:group I intron endonuclease
MVKMSGKKYLVYKHTNKVNGLVYIGITSIKPNARWKNGKGYIENEYFWEDIEKYGWDGFDHEILYSGLSETQAAVLEVSLIAYYDLTNREKGYNKSEGGDIVSEETRQKMSESLKGENNPMYGKHHTEEAKQKISESNTGRHHTEEAKQKISESKKGEKHRLYGKFGKDHNCSKTVICITTRQVYYGTYEAERATGIKYQSISRACNGRGKSAGKLPDGTKLRWKFVKDLPKPQVPEDIKQLLRNGPKPLKLAY